MQRADSRWRAYGSTALTRHCARLVRTVPRVMCGNYCVRDVALVMDGVGARVEGEGVSRTNQEKECRRRSGRAAASLRPRVSLATCSGKGITSPRLATYSTLSTAATSVSERPQLSRHDAFRPSPRHVVFMTVHSTSLQLHMFCQ